MWIMCRWLTTIYLEFWDGIVVAANHILSDVFLGGAYFGLAGAELFLLDGGFWRRHVFDLLRIDLLLLIQIERLH